MAWLGYAGLWQRKRRQDWAILMMISALPLARPPDPDMPRCQVEKGRRNDDSPQVELRGGVPVGLWMGLAVPQAVRLASGLKSPPKPIKSLR